MPTVGKNEVVALQRPADTSIQGEIANWVSFSSSMLLSSCELYVRNVVKKLANNSLPS
jgi:hypothetical protein